MTELDNGEWRPHYRPERLAHSYTQQASAWGSVGDNDVLAQPGDVNDSPDEGAVWCGP